jgi:L-asparagine oxygenase
MTRHSEFLLNTAEAQARLTAGDVLEVTISNNTREKLRENLGHLPFPQHRENEHITQVRQAVYAAFGLPVSALIESVRVGSIAPVAVTIRNLPHEDVEWSPAPDAPPRSAKSTDLSENLLVGIAGMLGEPYGIVNEGLHLVNNLIPSRADVERLTGNGSRRQLGLHVENAAPRWIFPARDLSPAWLVLAGVSEQKSGGPHTIFSSGRRAAALLTQCERAILAAPCVRIAVPERWRDKAGLSTHRTNPVPILAGPPGREIITAAFYGDMHEPVSDEAAEAIAAFDAALNRVADSVAVVPGTALAIPNAHTLHGRQSFEPILDEDGRAQRWLQRVFVTGRLDQFDVGVRLSDRVFDLLAA